MFGKNAIVMTFVLVVLVGLVPAGGAWAAQDGRQAAPGVFSQQAGTPPPDADPQPVVDILAAYFGVAAEEIQALYDSGAGFGIIAEAYVLAGSGLTDMTPEEIVAAKAAGDLNWGQLLKDAGQNPGQTKVKLGDIVSGTRQAEGLQQGAAVTSGGLGEQEQNKVQTQSQDRERSEAKVETKQQSQNQEQSGGGSGSSGSGSGGSGNGGGGGKGK